MVNIQTEKKTDETHKFRLWLTSMPDDAFP